MTPSGPPTTEARPTFGCSVCDGDMDTASTCGCCGSGNCAVFCGCVCPSEYWCDVCRCSHENAHLCAVEAER